MRKLVLVLVGIVLLSSGYANNFEQWFHNKSLRLDYFHSGSHNTEYYSFKKFYEEPYWGGSQINLIDTFNYGHYKFELIDKASGTVIYSRGYNTFFNEWTCTEMAKTMSRSFEESVVMPFPKKEARIVFYARNLELKWDKRYEVDFDPTNIFIQRNLNQPFPVKDLIIKGDAAEQLDIVIIPEGYTAEEMDQFVKDAKDLTQYINNSRPFSKLKGRISYRAIMAPSKESGTDNPGADEWKNTLLNSSFWTFGSERYLTTQSYHAVRDVAANAPYDQIFILTNTDKYGGAGFFNFYSMIAAGNRWANFLAIHEFGHGFAGLADEYYSSEVAVQDFHPLDYEPWEPNITTLKNFGAKWENMVKKSTPTPTPVCNDYLYTVGVFEGGGYVAKGVFRPYVDCTMKSLKYDNFCPVCQAAIKKMVLFYSQKKTNPSL